MKVASFLRASDAWNFRRSQLLCAIIARLRLCLAESEQGSVRDGTDGVVDVGYNQVSTSLLRGVGAHWVRVALGAARSH